MPTYLWECPKCGSTVEGTTTISDYVARNGVFTCECGAKLTRDDRIFTPPAVKVEKLNENDEPCFDYGLGKITTSIVDKREKLKRAGLMQMPQDFNASEQVAADERDHTSHMASIAKAKRKAKRERIANGADIDSMSEKEFDKWWKNNSGRIVEETYGKNWRKKVKQVRENGRKYKKRNKMQIKI